MNCAKKATHINLALYWLESHISSYLGKYENLNSFHARRIYINPYTIFAFQNEPLTLYKDYMQSSTTHMLLIWQNSQGFAALLSLSKLSNLNWTFAPLRAKVRAASLWVVQMTFSKISSFHGIERKKPAGQEGYPQCVCVPVTNKKPCRTSP